jgi:hypothetical protein
MGLIRDAMPKKKKGPEEQKIETIEDTYGVENEEEEETPSILDLFAQFTAEKIKKQKGKSRLAEVE